MSTRFQISKTMQTKESRETPVAFYNGERGVLERLLDAVIAKITILGRENIGGNRQGPIGSHWRSGDVIRSVTSIGPSSRDGRCAETRMRVTGPLWSLP